MPADVAAQSVSTPVISPEGLPQFRSQLCVTAKKYVRLNRWKYFHVKYIQTFFVHGNDSFQKQLISHNQ